MVTTIVKRPVVVDIDDDAANGFADRFIPSGAQTSASIVLATGDDGWSEAEQIKIVDHAFFAKHRQRWEYIRELLPGEFEGPLESPPPEKRWMVKVTAFRDFDKRVMFRIREAILLNATT